MNQVFTAGYQGMQADTLPRLVEALNLVVIDVRLFAASPCPRWRGSALRKAIGPQYTHLPQWGNVNYKKPEAGIQILDYAAGLDAFRRIRISMYHQGCDYLLLCGCPERAGCHREVLARALSLTGEGVMELDWRGEIKKMDAATDKEPA